jgi:HD-GYP domain-containing protein (c-di-GMP phosphodiesterase class II)
MESGGHRLSIFSQSLDRAAFLAYLLGAIVPLLALGYVAQRYVLPEIDDERAMGGLIGLILSIAALSLGSFLALQRTTRQSLARMDEDNRHLAITLDAARSLAETNHRSDAAGTLASCALGLAMADAAFVLIRDKQEEGGLSLLAQSGDGATSIHATHQALIAELASRSIESGCPAAAAPTEGSERDRGSPAVALVPITAERRVAGVIAVLCARQAAPFRTSQLNSLSTLAALGSVALRNAELQDAQRNFFTHVTEMIVGALDSHVDYHKGHAHRVAHIANRIGHEMGFDSHRLERLHFASLLHDVGMLRIPREQHEQKAIVRKHPAVGHRMLVSIRLWEDLAPLVLHHHEWWNGGGYPEGIAGEAIPLESRIIGLAEAVDSMTSVTSYKAPVPPEEARRRVAAAAGTQFDPEVARIFLELFDRGVIELQSR